MRLLERDEPLAVLGRLRLEAATGGGRLVFVEGEAGVGKTSLLRAYRDSLPQGVTSLLGSCDPLSTPRPLGPLAEIADDLDPVFAATLRDGAGRAEVPDALLAALGRRRAGDVVLLDDLHWADEATLDALRYVGRRIETTHALIVGSYRDDEVGRGHPLRVLVGDLATSPAVRRLSLAGLSIDAVRELARGTDLDPVALHARTDGNPFYVTEVIAGAPTVIPATVRDAVLARVARLSAAARDTLEAAAVIGPTIQPVLLARVVDRLAAEESLATGLLQSTGRRYGFRHELARQAILDAIDPAHRATLHARVLAELEAGAPGDRSLAVLAHHADEAGDGAAALRYAREAAREASSAGAHRQAAAQLARARRYAATLPLGEQAAVSEDLGKELSAIARNDEAIPALEEAIRLWLAAGRVAQAAGALATLATGFIFEGRNAEAEGASHRALELAVSLPDGPAKARVIAVRAYLRLLAGDNAEAIELAQRALAIAERHPLAYMQVGMALTTLGGARILSGDLAGQEDLERSLRRSLGPANDERGLDRLAAFAYSVFVASLGEMYEFARADPVFAAALPYTSERDLDGWHGYLQAWNARVMLHRGRWSEAGTVAAAILVRPGSMAMTRIAALLVLGRLRARRGDPDAWAALDMALAIAEPTATFLQIAPVRAARAEAAWLEGDSVRCGDEARRGLDIARTTSHPWHAGELLWWLAKAGTPADDTVDAARPWRLQLDGQWRGAAAAWRAVECPYEVARALLESPLVADVNEAHATFDRLGARPAAAMAVRRLRELGAPAIPRGPRASTRANPAGLTARELEVLGLVARGLPNQAIAARLFLSTRTVDHHVSAVLGKLEVTRRGDVAAAAARAGIDVAAGADSVSSPPARP